MLPYYSFPLSPFPFHSFIIISLSFALSLALPQHTQHVVLSIVPLFSLSFRDMFSLRGKRGDEDDFSSFIHIRSILSFCFSIKDPLHFLSFPLPLISSPYFTLLIIISFLSFSLFRFPSSKLSANKGRSIWILSSEHRTQGIYRSNECESYKNSPTSLWPHLTTGQWFIERLLPLHPRPGPDPSSSSSFFAFFSFLNLHTISGHDKNCEHLNQTEREGIVATFMFNTRVFGGEENEVWVVQ